MKLVNKIIFSFVLIFITEYSYAQGINTKVVIKSTISSTKVYLNGKLLNDNKTERKLKHINNYSIFNVNEELLFASIRIDNNINLFDNNKINNFTNRNNFDKKDYSNIKFDFTNDNEEEHFYDKPVFKILLGSFVAFGAATAYFKIKADKKFNDYKKTKNSSLLDDTNKYDAISGVTFSLMQINLGVLIYYFLRD